MTPSPELPDFVAPGGRFDRVPDPDALPRIDSRFVHKMVARNVVLSRVELIPGEEDAFEGELTPDWDHPFFFEHPLDHIPSMMLVEAGRQLGIAISHMYLGVPLGVVFITDKYDIRFTGFGEVGTADPVLLRAQVLDKTYRRDRLQSAHMTAEYLQGGRSIGGMAGTFTFYPREAYKRLRRLIERRGH